MFLSDPQMSVGINVEKWWKSTITTRPIWGQFQFQNWLFKKNGIGIDKFGIRILHKKLNSQINLPFIFFNSEIFLPWQSYMEYKLLGVGIQSRYYEYLQMAKSSR